MHLTRLYELEKPQQTEIVISEKRNICDKSWSYTDSIGGLDVEKKLFSPFVFIFSDYFLLCWLEEFSIVKVAAEDGAGFGGDCRGSR